MQRPGFITPALALSLGLLAGCDSPSPRFSGAAQQSVTVGDSTFSVHRLGDEVEVYRTSVEWMPSLSATLTKAEQAIVQATGCKVRPGTLVGDPALMTAELDCG